MSTLSSRVTRSTAWSVSGSAVMRVGQLFVGIAAARLLAPEAFGLFSVTLVVYAIVVNISELGVASSVIRTRLPLGEIVPTATTLAWMSSALLSLGMLLAAPVVATQFGAPGATGPIRLMVLVVLLAGPSAIPAALLTREFRQDLRFVADLSNFAVSNTLLIVLAVGGHGVYALALSRVAGQAVSVAILLAVSKRRLEMGWDTRTARSLMGFGLPLVGANLVGFAVTAVDVAVIGRALGPTPLGAYNLAMNIAGWPMQLFVPVLINVGLPLISRFQGERDRLESVCRHLLRLTSGLFFPVAALTAGLASHLVAALYGAKWSATVPVLAVLGAYGAVRLVLALLSDILVAGNRPRGLMVVQGAWLVALVPATATGVAIGGLIGAAVAVLLVSLAVPLPLSLALVGRSSAVPGRVMSRELIRPLLCALLCGAVAHAVASLVAGTWAGLLTGGLSGAAAYALLMRTTLVASLRKLRALLGEAPVEARVETVVEHPVVNPEREQEVRW